jgi:hypothetical protein
MESIENKQVIRRDFQLPASKHSSVRKTKMDVDFLEARHQIKEPGYKRHLAQQMGEDQEQ